MSTKADEERKAFLSSLNDIPFHRANMAIGTPARYRKRPEMWNYRILRRVYELHENEGVRETFNVHEVYYLGNDDDSPNSCSADPMEPHGETLEELERDYKRMASAFQKPVLEYQFFLDRNSKT